MIEVKHKDVAIMKKPSLVYTVALLCIAGNLAYSQQEVPICPCENPVDCVQERDACDPVFFQTDPMSNLGMLLFKQSEIQMVLQLKERGTLIGGEREAKRMEAFNAIVNGGDKKKIYEEVLRIWGSGVSADLLRYALLTGIGLVEHTHERETLRFLLEALDNPQQKREEVILLASGNGLQRRKAAHLFSVLRVNPQFQYTESGH
jgi:hypothetical protein